jgi:hypothetical protein
MDGELRISHRSPAEAAEDVNKAPGHRDLGGLALLLEQTIERVAIATDLL